MKRKPNYSFINFEKFEKNTQGFTIIELSIAVVIAILISCVMVLLYIKAERHFFEGFGLLDVHRNARLAMDVMSKDIRSSSQILGSQVFESVAYETGSSSIILEVPVIDSNGTHIGTDYIAYYNPTGTDYLKRIVDADGTSPRSDEHRIVSTSVDSLIFSVSTGSESVDISLVTKKEIVGRSPFQEVLSSTITLRNQN